MPKLAYSLPVGYDCKARALPYSLNASGGGAAYTAKFAEAAFSATSIQQPFFFRAGTVGITDGIPVTVPQKTGFVFTGGGQGEIAGESATARGPSVHVVRLTSSITFNGTTVRATSSGASATITLVGTTVASHHVGYTLNITSGTNFTAGFYVVVSVSTGSNTWTLDRTCTTGVGAAMVGFATPDLWLDRGRGNFYGGIGFRGNFNPNLTTKSFVGLHVDTNRDDVVSTGKHVLEYCSFSNFESAILCGRDLRYFDAVNDGYTGSDAGVDKHADNMAIRDCEAKNCTVFFHTRTPQSVGHLLENIQTQSVRDVIYLERGGSLEAKLIKMAGVNARLCRIGKINSNSGPVVLRSASWDAQSFDPQLVVMDAIGDGGNMQGKVEYAHLDAGITDFDEYLIDLYGACHWTFEGCNRIGLDSIRLRAASGAPTKVPHVTLRNCQLEGVSTSSTPEEVVDVSECDSGATVTFENCTNADGTVRYTYGGEQYGTYTVPS